MNFLALCQQLRKDCSMSGSGPTTTINQSGQMAQVVEWVNRAYREVLNSRKNWRFLYKNLQFSTLAGLQAYLPTGVGYSDIDEWVLFSLRVATSPAHEIALIPMDWELFRDAYQLGSLRSQTGIPVFVTIDPANALQFFPTPNDAYTIKGEYLCLPPDLAADTDIPVLPEKFHRLIVYKALMYYGTEYAANEKYVFGENQYRLLKYQMERYWLPKTALCGAWA